MNEDVPLPPEAVCELWNKICNVAWIYTVVTDVSFFCENVHGLLTSQDCGVFIFFSCRCILYAINGFSRKRKRVRCIPIAHCKPKYSTLTDISCPFPLLFLLPTFFVLPFGDDCRFPTGPSNSTLFCCTPIGLCAIYNSYQAHCYFQRQEFEVSGM